jgi:hypothetical protein
MIMLITLFFTPKQYVNLKWKGSSGVIALFAFLVLAPW